MKLNVDRKPTAKFDMVRSTRNTGMMTGTTYERFTRAIRNERWRAVAGMIAPLSVEAQDPSGRYRRVFLDWIENQADWHMVPSPLKAAEEFDLYYDILTGKER